MRKQRIPIVLIQEHRSRNMIAREFRFRTRIDPEDASPQLFACASSPGRNRLAVGATTRRFGSRSPGQSPGEKPGRGEGESDGLTTERTLYFGGIFARLSTRTFA